jgi:hypothetical protein
MRQFIKLRSTADQKRNRFGFTSWPDWNGRNMIWISILAGAVALFMIRRVWKEGRFGFDSLEMACPSGLASAVLLFFQALELQRYLEDLTYRPFFGLYASLLFAAVVWFSARLFVNIDRR